MFFYLLEKSGIIKFDKNDRNKFIEYNFQYTDVRNNGKGDQPQPLTDIDRHFSIFKSHSSLKENDKTKKKLIEKIDKMKEIDIWLDQFRKITEESFQRLDQVLFTIKNKKK